MKRNPIIVIFLIVMVSVILYRRLFRIIEFLCLRPVFNRTLWNHPKFKKNNNCYTYAMNRPNSDLTKKRYPAKGKVDRDFGNFTCSYFDELMKTDNPSIANSTRNQDCQCNEYKIAMVIDDNNTPLVRDNDDFHFYRQDQGTDIWSHKQGGSAVSRVDASGNIIYDPETADRKYKTRGKGNHDYNKFCGYYCVPYDDQKYIKAIHEIKNI